MLLNTKSLNIKLFKTLGFAGLAFLVTGLIINLFFAIPTMTLLIDRSYCPNNQWQQVTQAYTDLYDQHQRGKLRLQRVILFSSLDQEILNSPPLPETVAALSTYGRSNHQRQIKLQETYPNFRFLGCR